MKYAGKREAKEWARANMHGVANVVIPTFTSDFKRLNEKAIRHDVRRNIELGFEGTLLVSEAGTTVAEYKQFIDLAVDEAKDNLQVLVQGSFDTLEDTVEVLQHGQTAGIDAYLFAWPNGFYPKTGREVIDYIKAVNDQTELGCIVFPAPYWNFGRIHPSGFPLEYLEEVADIPNVIAFKFEAIGYSPAATLQVFKRLGQKVIVADPFDVNAPLWAETVQQQWLGTSNYEYFADCIPQMWKLLKGGQFDEAMEIYWRLTPARSAKGADKDTWAGANFLHRYSWKYQSWLNGYNGGPIRMPVMRLTDKTMQSLRQGLEKSGITTTETPDSEFFVGRNPA